MIKEKSENAQMTAWKRQFHSNNAQKVLFIELFVVFLEKIV